MFEKKEKPKMHIEPHCLTMTNPATGFFEVAEIGKKTADVIANRLKIYWLSRHP